ncbi:hypothetical protein LZ30DRAFT_405102 [Colletotrichum cereale]|nr:hypothetical protein LZ30DRAFT_405102 [Colletotrichum cereale]
MLTRLPLGPRARRMSPMRRNEEGEGGTPKTLNRRRRNPAQSPSPVPPTTFASLSLSLLFFDSLTCTSGVRHSTSPPFSHASQKDLGLVAVQCLCPTKYGKQRKGAPRVYLPNLVCVCVCVPSTQARTVARPKRKYLRHHLSVPWSCAARARTRNHLPRPAAERGKKRQTAHEGLITAHTHTPFHAGSIPASDDGLRALHARVPVCRRRASTTSAV